MNELYTKRIRKAQALYAIAATIAVFGFALDKVLLVSLGVWFAIFGAWQHLRARKALGKKR